MERQPELHEFLSALGAVLNDGRLSPAASQSIGRVFSALETAVPSEAGGGVRPPVCALLSPALDTAEKSNLDLAAVITAFRTLMPVLDWKPRAGNATASANFADRHANTMIVGPGGLEERSDVWIGASLLAPDVRYPDHRHTPEEVYLVLSSGEFRQEDGDWFEPGIGGTFYNRPNILHAMRSGSTPLLALWCLWNDPDWISHHSL